MINFLSLLIYVILNSINIIASYLSSTELMFF